LWFTVAAMSLSLGRQSGRQSFFGGTPKAGGSSRSSIAIRPINGGGLGKDPKLPRTTFTILKESLAEMEHHLHHVEAENSRMKQRLMNTVRPVLMQWATGISEVVIHLTLEAWKRWAEEARISRLKDEHQRSLRAEHTKHQANAADLARSLDVEKRRRESLLAQIAHLNTRIEDSTAEIQRCDEKSQRLEEQLAAAESCIEVTKREAEQVASAVRLDVEAYAAKTQSLAENYEETTEFKMRSILPGRPKIQNVDTVLDSEARAELDAIQEKLAFIFDRMGERDASNAATTPNIPTPGARRGPLRLVPRMPRRRCLTLPKLAPPSTWVHRWHSPA